jgi:hypothetical protein
VTHHSFNDWVYFENPTEEHINYAAGIIRLFDLKKERLSINNIGLLRQDAAVSDDWRAGFETFETHFDYWLNTGNFNTLYPGDWRNACSKGLVSARDLFDAFVYGDDKHTDQEKMEMLRGWTLEGQGLTVLLMYGVLLWTLSRVVIEFGDACEKLLRLHNCWDPAKCEPGVSVFSLSVGQCG